MQMLRIIAQAENIYPAVVFLLILTGYPIVAGLTVYYEVENNSLSVLYRVIVLVSAVLLVISTCVKQKLLVNYKILIGASFTIYYIIRMFFEWLNNAQGSKIDWSEFWIFLLLVCLIPTMPFMWKRNLPIEDYMPDAIIFLGIFGLVLNFFSILQNEVMTARDLMFSGRLETERLNPIAYGHLATTTALMGIWELLIRRKISILGIVGAIIGILGVAASGSRGPMLSLMVCLLFMLMRINIRSIGVCIVFVIAGGVIAWSNNGEIYILGRIKESMFTDSGRSEIYVSSYQAFMDNVLIGAGYPYETYPHNLVLEAFMSSGIFGGALMIAVLTVGLVAALMNMKNIKSSWLSILFIQYFMFSMVSNSIYYSNILWMLWVCIIIARGDVNDSRDEYNAGVYIK